MKRVMVIGNGNWGTTAAKIIAENVSEAKGFCKEVLMYVRKETYQDTKISEYINKFQTNPKYLKDIKLPKNIKAVEDINIANEADIIVVCVPHQYIDIIKDLKPKKGAFAINLSKGFLIHGEELLMPSIYIKKLLGIECCCLMGPNIASEVAEGKLAECTIGFTEEWQAEWLVKMFKNDYFLPKVIPYSKGIEICSGIKNIISLAYGIARGMKWGANTEAIVFRKGLVEMERFCKLIKTDFLVLESCCIGDLLTSSISGRNYKCGVEMAECKNMHCEIEKKLGGQKLQGPGTAKSVCEWLKTQGLDEESYPLFFSIYKICYLGESPESLKSILIKFD